MASHAPTNENLFPPPPQDFRAALELLPQILESVWPLKTAHKKSLPRDIRDLSRVLTASRGEMHRPYWMNPAFVSAYLYFFLPWNIIRLGRLFAGLNLPTPKIPASLLIDLGSGPLALPIALWLASPQLRDTPLNILAIDTAPRPPRLGHEIYKRLAETSNQTPWPVHIARGSLFTPPRRLKIPQNHDAYQPWLLTAANVLNELPSGDTEDEANKIEQIFENWEPVLAQMDAESGILLVEPGTRLGGELIVTARKAALDLGLFPAAPCVASNPCPLMEKGKNSGYDSSWCHFNFPADDAPAWLRELTLDAGFERRDLSLSPLFLKTRPYDANSLARVISGPFPVPGLKGRGRYACSGKGLVLLENAASLPEGSLARVNPAPPFSRDPKSGALILRDGVAKTPSPRRAPRVNKPKNRGSRDL